MFLGVLLFSSVLFLKISAENSYTMLSWDCFSGQYFSSQNANLSTDENGHLNISFKRTAPMLTVNVNSDIANVSQNAIRLCMTNNSACNSLLFTYQYLDEKGETQTVSEKIALGTRSLRGDYYIYTEVADRITNISMTFSGISSGSISIMSIDFVSIYNDKEDACGTMTACFYDRAKNAIEISGNVKYEIVTAHRKARLVLYAVDMDMNSLPYGSIPLASVPMSSHFDFSLSKTSIEERMKAYVVAVVSEGGELLYTFSPRVPTSDSGETEEERFFKGVHSDFGVLAARANAGLVIVDVDFARLASSNVGEGLLHAFGGQYFYFNRQYLSSIDAEIQKYYENGMSVALRFMSSATSETDFSPLLADSEETLLRLYAYTEFLCNRYSSSSRGVVSSIIFGTCADAVSSREGSMIKYTRFYADSLFAVSEAMISTNRNIQLIVPISDHLEKGKEGDVFFSPRLFLTSLGKILQKRYVGGIHVKIMVESDALSGEGALYEQLGFEQIQELSIFLRQSHDAYPTISEQYLYYWEPDDTGNREYLRASLLHGYYALACERDSYGFVLSTSCISDVSLVSELMSCLQFADTSLGQKNADSALAVLERSDWQELIVGHSEEKIQTVEYREISDVTTAPFRFLGESYLWDFSGMGNDYGWIAGDGCESVIMAKYEETNRALAAKMIPRAENNYESELIYCFDEARSFSAVDAVSFALCMDAPDGKYRVTIQICGKNVISESSLTLPAGKLSTVYVNTADLFIGEEIRCIRIFTTSVSGSPEEYTLLIGSISAHSTTQKSEVLEEQLKATQGMDVYENRSQKIEPIWFYVIGFLAFISVMVIVALYFRNEEET